MSYLFFLLISFFSFTFSFAYTPEIVCGGVSGNAPLEIDFMYHHRGGTKHHQLVLRDKNIIDYFEENEMILKGDLNEKNELIFRGAGYTFIKEGYYNGRTITADFYPPSTLVIEGFIRNKNQTSYGQKIVNFIFHDCYKL